MKQEQAETISIQALGWLATDADLMGVFLGSTGADLNNLKQSATDPVFLGAVLDFLLADDSRVIGFCQATGLTFEAPMQARQMLPGGQAVNWT